MNNFINGLNLYKWLDLSNQIDGYNWFVYCLHRRMSNTNAPKKQLRCYLVTLVCPLLCNTCTPRICLGNENLT